jgi:hypothetical protein
LCVFEASSADQGEQVAPEEPVQATDVSEDARHR